MIEFISNLVVFIIKTFVNLIIMGLIHETGYYSLKIITLGIYPYKNSDSLKDIIIVNIVGILVLILVIYLAIKLFIP